MDNRARDSILDLTLRARHLRSACLAELLRRSLQRVRNAARRSSAPLREPAAALERR